MTSLALTPKDIEVIRSNPQNARLFFVLQSHLLFPHLYTKKEKTKD